LITSYELGDWAQVDQLSRLGQLPPPAIREAYLEATVWAEQVVQSVGD
jgi:hypothetical protein